MPSQPALMVNAPPSIATNPRSRVGGVAGLDAAAPGVDDKVAPQICTQSLPFRPSLTAVTWRSRR